MTMLLVVLWVGMVLVAGLAGQVAVYQYGSQKRVHRGAANR